MPAYPELSGEIAKRGIKKSVLAKSVGISCKTLYNKINGVVPFTWPEVCKIQSTFFPDKSKETLFSLDSDHSA